MKEHQYEYGGAIIVWSAADSDYQLVSQAVEDLGEQFKECRPSKPTPLSALKMALQKIVEPDVKGHNILVRNLRDMDGRGFVVAQEDPKVKGPLRFRQRHAAVFYNDQHYEIEPALGTEDQLRLSKEYHCNLTQIGPTSVGVCLADVVRAMGGVPLRESGGVYWLPDEKLAEWKSFASAVERAGQSRVYALKVRAEPEMIRCVGDNLVTMAQTQLDEMMDAVRKSEVNESTVSSRKRKLESLAKQVEDFEAAFDRSLEEIRPRLEEAKSTLLLYNLIESGMEQQP